jgi:hypothetical protein
MPRARRGHKQVLEAELQSGGHRHVARHLRLLVLQSAVLRALLRAAQPERVLHAGLAASIRRWRRRAAFVRAHDLPEHAREWQTERPGRAEPGRRPCARVDDARGEVQRGVRARARAPDVRAS